MPKQADPGKPALARPDRAGGQARKEAVQRVEELKLRLMVMVDSNFEQSLRIIKGWIRDGEKDNGKKKR